MTLFKAKYTFVISRWKGYFFVAGEVLEGEVEKGMILSRMDEPLKLDEQDLVIDALETLKIRSKGITYTAIGLGCDTEKKREALEDLNFQEEEILKIYRPQKK